MIREHIRLVLFHTEDGAYLGNCLGLSFFSNIDPVGQLEAVTFASQTEAFQHVQSWDPDPESTAFRNALVAKPVNTADAPYATIQQIQAAGLPGWNHESI